MKKKGFTLLEVLIGLAIFSILLIPTANIILQTVKNNKNNEDKQKARLAAQKIIEEIKALGSISDITLSNGVRITPTNPATNPPSYHISGVVDGFDIYGKIILNASLHDEYGEIANKNVSCIIEVNESNMKFRYSPPMSIDSYIKDKVSLKVDLDDPVNLNINVDVSNISINLNSYPIASTEPIVILLNNDRSSMSLNPINPINPVSITIKNGGVNRYDVYIVRNYNIDMDPKYRIDIEKNYIIKKIEGNINTYTSDINTDNEEKGIYSVSLQISKDSKVIENINTQKTVK